MASVDIAPVTVGDPVRAEKPCPDALLERFGIYVQPINYPTVPRGTERLRFYADPTSACDAMMRHLVESLDQVWAEFGLQRRRARGQIRSRPTDSGPAELWPRSTFLRL